MIYTRRTIRLALMVTQFGNLFTGNANVIGTICAAVILVFMIYMLFFKKYEEATERTN